MTSIKQDKNLIAYCGLYCGACRAFLKGKCLGCRENKKADRWCKVRLCCQEKQYFTCAECQEFSDPKDCKKMNNIFSKFFKLIFGSNRFACIACIKEKGCEIYAQEMAEKSIMTLKK